ncbi:hypothetical protein [Neorhizobium sp. JUb45]|uniref:hypothetical protein n=1 Tax=unclassified Neorhizobium TaxID=2629175 RepID=UPI001051EAA1|nr:hypothetical protein [Neorhizobium sp. JUb45]TCR05058.1 hypothetical protein EDF70_1021174 [Neorhizobium sp. JUb45]
MPAALPRMKAIGCSTAAAFLWGLAMMITATAGLLLRGRVESFHLPTILLVFFAGGVLGWWLADLVGHFFQRIVIRRRVLAVLAFAGLAAATVFVTAGLFALEYRSFYAQWHAETLSGIWFLQFIFTSASAFYQFAVMATRLYLPLGPLFLFAGTWIMLRRMR